MRQILNNIQAGKVSDELRRRGIPSGQRLRVVVESMDMEEPSLTFHFCPTCGSTVYWESEGFPGHVAVAIGSFADPKFPAPTIAVWEEARHPWIALPPDTPPKRMPKQG